MEKFLYVCVNFKTENMKKNLFFLLFIAIGLTSCSNGVNIESTEAVNEFIKGKWHDETVETGGVITYYRFEITETEIKCWKSHLLMSNNGVSADNITDDWAEQTPVTLSIGNVETDSSTNHKYRTLGNSSYGTYNIERVSNGDVYINFKDNNSINSDTECTLKKGWEY